MPKYHITIISVIALSKRSTDQAGSFLADQSKDAIRSASS